MKKALIVIAAFIIPAALVLIYGFISATRLPENRPENFIKNRPAGEYKTVVCVGDSITHASVSFDYVHELERRMANQGYYFVNAGINSELAWNVLHRINDIIACDPDYITILIGTNDANGTITDENAKRQVKEMRLPRRPSPQWYRENLVKICSLLKSETDARIALLTIPPIGEDPDDMAFRRASEFSKIIRDVAIQQGVTCLPLNDKMTAFLSENGADPSVSYKSLRSLMYRGIFMRKIFRKSYDDISSSSGFLLVTDFLHLNSRAGKMVADQIEDFIHSQ